VGIPERKGITMKNTTPPKTATPAAAPLSDIYTRVFDAAIHDLSIEEGEIPTLARKILRMRRDRAPHNELLQITEPLFKSIVGSAIEQEWAPDPESGMSRFRIKPTPALKTLLRKLHKSA
jgi:hypothetical protein